jgi:hypothetical protein
MTLANSAKWKLLRARLYLEHIRVRAFYLPAAIFLLITFLLVDSYQMYRYFDLWSDKPLAGGNAFTFCEANHMNEAIRQPSNTWSNLAYLLVALFAFTVGVHDYKNKEHGNSTNFLVRYPFFSIMYGLSCLYLFIGSFMYHASLTAFYQKLDQTGLYSVIAMILVLNVYKIFPYINHRGEWRDSQGLAKALIVILNILFFNWLWKFSINVFVPLLIVIIFITSLYYIVRISKTHYFSNYLYAAFFLLFAAGSIWVLDRQGVVCNPDSIFQGHALWHILTAVSIFFIYLYYRSGSLHFLPGELEDDEEENHSLAS